MTKIPGDRAPDAASLLKRYNELADSYTRVANIANERGREVNKLRAEIDRLNTALAEARAETAAMEAWKDLALMRGGRTDDPIT